MTFCYSLSRHTLDTCNLYHLENTKIKNCFWQNQVANRELVKCPIKSRNKKVLSMGKKTAHRIFSVKILRKVFLSSFIKLQPARLPACRSDIIFVWIYHVLAPISQEARYCGDMI